MAKFRCKNCNYQFNSDVDASNRVCPNCGERNSIRPEQSATDLLNDED